MHLFCSESESTTLPKAFFSPFNSDSHSFLYTQNENEEKDDLIGKLRNEIESLRESLAEKRREQQENSSPVVQRISPRGSPQQPRPHSYHVGLSGEGGSTGEGGGAGEEGGAREEGGTGNKVEDSRELVLSPSTTGSTHDSEYESSDTSTLLVVEHV